MCYFEVDQCAHNIDTILGSTVPTIVRAMRIFLYIFYFGYETWNDNLRDSISVIHSYLYDETTSNPIQQSKLYVELVVSIIAPQILCHIFPFFMCNNKCGPH